MLFWRFNIAIKIKKRYQGRQREINVDLINERIPRNINEILVIDQNGQKIGTFSRDAALNEAHKRNLDLVLISKNDLKPVAKIIDYGKYRFEKRKKEQQQRKNSKTIEQKELRISVNIGIHDMNVKVKNARKFLEKGHSLKITLIFKGREMRNKDLGHEKINEFIKFVADVSELKKGPIMSGRYYSVYLVPKKIKK